MICDFATIISTGAITCLLITFFTSIPLVRYLYCLQIYVTGTVRANRTFLSEYFRNKFLVGELKYFRNNKILTYREKKIAKETSTSMVR